MYGRGMSCDVCQHTEIIPAERDVYLVDSAPVGWIRLVINRPKVYNWDKDRPKSQTEIALDCCSIYCARSALSDAQGNLPAEQPAEVSA